MKSLLTLPFRKLRSKAFALLIPAFLTLFVESDSSLAAGGRQGSSERFEANHGHSSLYVMPLDKLQDTLKTSQQAQAILSRKLQTWIKVTESDTVMGPSDLMAFVRANPDWPRQQMFRDKIEQSASGYLSNSDIVSWFQDHAPKSAQGITAYVDALQSLNQNALAQKKISEFWRTGGMTKDETISLAKRYGSLLNTSDHDARLDNMIWAENLGQAEAVLPYASSDARTLGRARIALARKSAQATQYVDQVPAHLQSDEGLMFERFRWRRRSNLDAGAIEILNKAPDTTAHADAWWKEINILSRRAIEEKRYGKAYDITKKHALTSGGDFAQAEWLLGWLSLAENRPIEAYKHFDHMYNGVQSALSRSRAAYWAARTSEVLRDTTTARQWDRVAAQYPSTFYGQLSHAQIDSLPPVLPASTIDTASWQVFNTKETVRAARMLKDMNQPKLVDTFLSRIVSDSKTQIEFEMSARLARELNRPYYAVQANKDAQQKLGVALFNDGYPTMSNLPLPQPEQSLVHAIIYRESMFNKEASSGAGAKGMMQLMPGTAKAMAKSQGKTYSAARLTSDPNYNISLGSGYLQQMLNRYDGFYPLAIAAYNAGPGNVDRWIDELGDPRRKGVNIIDWVEHIPIYETRNYVQRVMESYYVYRMQFGEKPRTILNAKP